MTGNTRFCRLVTARPETTWTSRPGSKNWLARTERSVWGTRRLVSIRIDTKRRVPHTERSVLASQFFEPGRDVHVVSGRAVTSLQNLVLPVIVLSHHRGRCKHHQADRGQMPFQYCWYAHSRSPSRVT